MIESLKKFDFKDLFILDLANNHQGSLEHGLNIIKVYSKICKGFNLKAAFKFQFRDLPGFVHIDEQKKPSNKHVDRFLSTKLSWDDFQRLRDEVSNQGMLAACTPFDENSVEKIIDLKFDLIKIASCSARDFPLLEAICATGLPTIASTGGLRIREIDELVSFLRHRAAEFALMHCVSIYPTPDEACNLSNIKNFIERYNNLKVGWSTHEPPTDTTQVGIAYSLGARIFERHIGLPTKDIVLNKYSSNPEEFKLWIDAWGKTKLLLGKSNRSNLLEEEFEAIAGLKRGVFAKKSLKSGQIITRKDIYFAFPYRENQLSSGDWKSEIKLKEGIQKDQPLLISNLEKPNNPKELIIKHAIHEVRALLSYAKIPLNHEFQTEYSHHYGIDKFREIGAILITIINREYAKKLIIQLPGQLHPWHFHKRKEETFLVVFGKLNVEIDEKKLTLSPGDQITVPPGVWHRFWSEEEGCIFEEISTTAYKNDSVYRDPIINKLKNEERKTKVDHWGRFQISDKVKLKNN